MEPPQVTPLQALEQLRLRLQDDWETLIGITRPDAGGPDFIIRLTAPDGQTAVLQCEIKTTVVPRDVPTIVDRLARSGLTARDKQGVVVARYLSENVRKALTEFGLGYIDLAGSIRVSVSRPGLFISEKGPGQDPWRGPGRPRGSLRGEPAARVVRALVDFISTMPVRDLVALSGASTGATYRVIDYLEEQRLIDRDKKRQVIVRDWAELLRLWARDYQFVKTNTTSRWLAPRGFPDLLQKMTLSDGFEYAVTGSLATRAWETYADTKTAMVYVEEAARAAAKWGLREVDAGANVILAEPKYKVVFDRTKNPGVLLGARTAAPSQVAVDLLSGPGRNPAEGEALIRWMEKDEQSWRI